MNVLVGILWEWNLHFVTIPQNFCDSVLICQVWHFVLVLELEIWDSVFGMRLRKGERFAFANATKIWLETRIRFLCGTGHLPPARVGAPDASACAGRLQGRGWRVCGKQSMAFPVLLLAGSGGRGVNWVSAEWAWVRKWCSKHLGGEVNSKKRRAYGKMCAYIFYLANTFLVLRGRIFGIFCKRLRAVVHTCSTYRTGGPRLLFGTRTEITISRKGTNPPSELRLDRSAGACTRLSTISLIGWRGMAPSPTIQSLVSLDRWAVLDSGKIGCIGEQLRVGLSNQLDRPLDNWTHSCVGSPG